ncbi:pseudouridine synthase [Nitratifractor sp.]
MRLNKFISHNTSYSRREADRLIEAGEVRIGRNVVRDFAYDVKENDKVFVKGRYVKPRKAGEVTMVVYNKPRGVLVTRRDDRGRPTIYHKLPGKFRRFIPVGRLDFASQGLLLLTDNPTFADLLMRSDLPRTYNLKIDKPLSDAMRKAMEEGLELEDATPGAHEKSAVRSMRFKPFAEVKVRGQSGRYTKLRVTITEGQNRELRRFFGHFGAKVLDLKRVAFGPIELNNLPENKTRYFTRQEYEWLHNFRKEAHTNDATDA